MKEYTDQILEAEKKAARQGLLVYFAILIVGSVFFETRILRSLASIDRVPGLIFALMYMPAVASVVARIALKEGFADISLRFGGREGGRAAFVGWVYPLVVGFVSYGVAWATGHAELQPPLSPHSHLYVGS